MPRRTGGDESAERKSGHIKGESGKLEDAATGQPITGDVPRISTLSASTTGYAGQSTRRWAA